MADKKDGKGAKAFENIAPLLGLATTLGTAIPGLKKPKRSSASTTAARLTQHKAASAAVGASQTGHGATRGLNLRSGLRAAGKVAQEGALAAAAAADLDETRFAKETTARNERLASFGKDLGEMTGAIGTGIAESRQAKQAEGAEADAAALEVAQQQAQASMPGIDEVMGIDPATGLPVNAAAQVQQQELVEQEVGPGPNLDQIEIDETGDAVPVGMDLDELAIGVDPIYAEMGLANKEQLYGLVPELNFQLRQENLALDEMTRQGIQPSRIYAQLSRLQNLPAVRELHKTAAASQFQGQHDQVMGDARGQQ